MVNHFLDKELFEKQFSECFSETIFTDFQVSNRSNSYFSSLRVNKISDGNNSEAIFRIYSIYKLIQLVFKHTLKLLTNE